jgi:hypothetical protein
VVVAVAIRVGACCVMGTGGMSTGGVVTCVVQWAGTVMVPLAWAVHQLSLAYSKQFGAWKHENTQTLLCHKDFDCPYPGPCALFPVPCVLCTPV